MLLPCERHHVLIPRVPRNFPTHPTGETRTEETRTGETRTGEIGPEKLEPEKFEPEKPDVQMGDRDGDAGMRRPY